MVSRMAKDYVINLYSRALQMICGSDDNKDMIKIENFQEYPLPEGAMINGVIIDEQPILDILKELKKNGIHEARTAISSGQVLVKILDVPILKKRELLQVVKDELSDISGSYEDLVYDYSVLQQHQAGAEQKGAKILCCAVERKLLNSYIELFERAGIHLKSIDIAVNALHKLTSELVNLTDKTYIISFLDANYVSSYLFENNHYTFSNRTRLFSERGTHAFTSEMNSNISQLIQFNQSKRSPYSIETAYFCGLDDEEEKVVFESIKQNLKIEALEFPDSKLIHISNAEKKKQFQLHDYVFSVGSLIRK